MSPKRLNGVGLVLLAGLVVTALLMQRRFIGQLSAENASLRGNLDRLAGLAKENEVLSNRLKQATTPQLAPGNPSPELLRLRGEVGVLRRQLHELQLLGDGRSPARPQTNPAAPSLLAASLRNTEGLRIEHKAEYVRLKTLLDKLQSDAPDAGASARILLLSGEDDLLKSWLGELVLAEQKLAALQQKHGPEDLEVAALRSQMDDLNAKLQTRSDGVLLGLNAKLAALKQSLEADQREAERLTEGL